jgi:hypothetical protein
MILVRMIKSRSLSWTGHVATMEESWSLLKISTDKLERNRPLGRPRCPLGRPRCRWEENIRMDSKNMNVNTRNWIDSVQG